MIQLPQGFDLTGFVSDIMTLGMALVSVATAFLVFKIINKALGYIRS